MPGRSRSISLLKADLQIRLCKALNLIVTVALFAAAWYGHYTDSIQVQYYRKGDWVIIGIYTALYILFARVFEAFSVTLRSRGEIIYSGFLAVLFSDGILFVVIWLLNLYFPNVVPILLCLAAQVLFEVIWTVTSEKWYFKKFTAKKTAIVYERRTGMEELIEEYDLSRKFRVDAVVKASECLTNLETLGGYETIFLAGVKSHDRNIILKYCVNKGIQAFVIPRVGDLIMSGALKVHMFHLPMLQVGRYSPTPEFRFAKRAFDIVVSLIGLIILSPIMLIISIAVKADGGPVFYKQVRLTKDAKEFKILKFRSMRIDAEKDGVARLSSGENDPRITKVGRIIRACRGDEIPQLLNILKGDMSIVGPRPERPELAEKIQEDIPEFSLRLQAKAGLTGYAQVYGKYNTTPYDKLLMDLMYISNPSFAEDLKICIATLKILFQKESTEGVGENKRL